MLSPEPRAAVEKALQATRSPEPSGEALARAQVLTEARLWYDAVAAYTDLIERFPEQGLLFEARAAIYSQLEVTRPLAEQDWVRAEVLEAASR